MKKPLSMFEQDKNKMIFCLLRYYEKNRYLPTTKKKYTNKEKKSTSRLLYSISFFCPPPQRRMELVFAFCKSRIVFVSKKGYHRSDDEEKRVRSSQFWTYQNKN